MTLFGGGARRSGMGVLVIAIGGGGLALIFMLLALVVIVVIGFAVPGSGIVPICGPSTGTEPGAMQRASESDSIPSNYLELYRKAGMEWNIPWYVLAGIGWVESRHGADLEGVHSGANYKDAKGPMQFVQGTFDGVAVDVDNDGPDPYDPEDAIFSAAKLLKVHIVGWAYSDDETRLKAKELTADELRDSILEYNNRSEEYLNEVGAATERYRRSHHEGPANYAGQSCASAGATGSFGQRIADEAAYYVNWNEGDGTPKPPNHVTTPTKYSWGGGSRTGPSRGICCSPGGYDARETWGFDCSGLARMAVYKASQGKIEITRTTYTMWRNQPPKGEKVSRNQLGPGDLVFFGAPDDVNHVGIYYGEFNGTHWMVEAPRTGVPVRFSDFDARSSYVGALRITPPAEPIRALSPTQMRVGVGAP